MIIFNPAPLDIDNPKQEKDRSVCTHEKVPVRRRKYQVAVFIIINQN